MNGAFSGTNQTLDDLKQVEGDAKVAGKKLCVRATDGSDGEDRNNWPTNGLRFDNVDKAIEWGLGLFGRWMGCRGWHVTVAPD